MTITAEGRTRMRLLSSIAGAAIAVGVVILTLWLHEAWAVFLSIVLMAAGAVVLGFILAVIVTEKPPGRHAGS